MTTLNAYCKYARCGVNEDVGRGGGDVKQMDGMGGSVAKAAGSLGKPSDG